MMVAMMGLLLPTEPVQLCTYTCFEQKPRIYDDDGMLGIGTNGGYGDFVNRMVDNLIMVRW